MNDMINLIDKNKMSKTTEKQRKIKENNHAIAAKA